MNPEPIQKNNRTKIYVIVGIAAVLLLAIVVTVIAAAAGVYFYSNNYKPERTFDAPADRAVPSNRNDPSRTSNTRTDALVEQLRAEKTVGKFTLQNIVPVRDGGAFRNSDGEAYAIYTSDKATVKMRIAEYTDRSLASVDFGRMIAAETKAGAKIVRKLRAKDGVMDIGFENGRMKTAANCIFTAKPRTVCHMLSSENAAAISNFGNSFWRK